MPPGRLCRIAWTGGFDPIHASVGKSGDTSECSDIAGPFERGAGVYAGQSHGGVEVMGTPYLIIAAQRPPLRSCGGVPIRFHLRKDKGIGIAREILGSFKASKPPFAGGRNSSTGGNRILVQPCSMISEGPDVGALVTTLRRHFEHDATRDEVRSAVRDACMAMYASGVAPQTMLVTLKLAVQSAALEARTVVARDALRSVTSDLTPWMIDVCFSPATNWQR